MAVMRLCRNGQGKSGEGREDENPEAHMGSRSKISALNGPYNKNHKLRKESSHSTDRGVAEFRSWHLADIVLAPCGG